MEIPEDKRQKAHFAMARDIDYTVKALIAMHISDTYLSVTFESIQIATQGPMEGRISGTLLMQKFFIYCNDFSMGVVILPSKTD